MVRGNEKQRFSRLKAIFSLRVNSLTIEGNATQAVSGPPPKRS
jgi:hypothetical protein